MAVFTLELWRAIELSPAGDIGLNEYEIYDETHRPVLNKLITDHYHHREIGVETIGMFRFALRRRMNEIMPFYNELFRSKLIEIDPLRTVDLKTLSTGESEGSATGQSENENNSSSESKSRAVQSSTPQVALSGRGDYATGAADTTSGGTSKGGSKDKSTSTNNDRSESESRTVGYQGSPSELLTAYRATLLNIDMMIVDELSDLFMGLWDNGDSFLPVEITRLNL